MQFQISVIQVDKTTQTSKTGKTYQQIEVTFKDLTAGNVKAKKLASFKYPEVFKALSDSKSGDTFLVTAEKEGEFWQWTGVGRDAPTQNEGLSTPSAAARVSTNTPVRSSYETPEERAVKQVFIIKQSSISAAVASLTPGAKAPLDPEAVLGFAQKFVDWVMEKPQAKEATLKEMEDDVPY